MGPKFQKILRELTTTNRKWAGVPQGGYWCNSKDGMVEHGKANGCDGCFMLAWSLPPVTIVLENGDEKIIKGGNYYGWYENQEVFFAALIRVKSDKRYAFELMEKTRKCNLYFDVESVASKEVEVPTILRIIAAIRAHLRVLYNAEFELQITRGSRETPKGFKCSFHIVVTGLVYENNHGGAMKECVVAIQESLEETDKWIDLGVYKTDGLMRTVLSRKRDGTALVNVTGDGFSSTETIFSNRVYEDSEVGARGNSMITCHDNSGVDVVYVANNDLSGELGSTAKTVATKRKRAPVECSEGIGMHGECFPALVTQALQEMVDGKGGKGCVVTGRYQLKYGHYSAICVNSGPRLCLANKNRPEHESDNAYLFFKAGHVQYRCHIERCKGKRAILGPYPEVLKEFFAPQVEVCGGPVAVCDVIALDQVQVESTETTLRTRTVVEFQQHQPYPELDSYYLNLAKPNINT